MSFSQADALGRLSETILVLNRPVRFPGSLCQTAPNLEVSAPFRSLLGVVSETKLGCVLTAHHRLFQTFDVFMSKFKDYRRSCEQLPLGSMAERLRLGL